MKTIGFIFLILIGICAHAQQHFSGINTSSRTGIINGHMNPAEFANINATYEVSILSLSVNASSNKVGFSDLINGNDLSALIFRGNQPANLRIDGEIIGPGVAYKWEKWAFALTTKAYAKLDVVDVDPNIGDAVTNSGISAFLGSTTIANNQNQRLNGTTWGEVGLSAARNIYEDENHKLNAGATLKILFPGSYANFGADQFTGTINNTLGQGTLTDANANLNIAYSGNLGDDFTTFDDYMGSLFGKPNGLAADIGVNYQWKDTEAGKYKINAGLSIRNMGGMTFNSANNASTDYILSIQGLESLDLNQFQNVNSLSEVETILLSSGYLNRTENVDTDFKVTLPTLFTAYADVKIIPDFFATIYTQQKMNKDEANDQITNQNVTSLTMRYVWTNVELMLPLSDNEISGFAGGVGFRAYGFFIGSSSIITAAFNDSKQADIYLGYSFAIR